MKLQKAIEESQDLHKVGLNRLTPDENDAIKLGIEALEWRALMEHDYGSWCGPLLPGETKE